ncbi:DUF2218 domain-containing protein [Micromonospora sp. SL4-19]|uniref:DUF2218 domain-containing protein n=1 Tax=Micromonospora sp. SL4-19 TaxID=3399129 RepID=UPI003A4D4497
MQGARPTTTTRLSSRADIVTDAPGRYAKQLVAHLGRKIEFRTDGPVSSAAIGEGAAQLVVGHGVLTLLATGDDERSMALIEQVLGSHLERFGRRAGLTVSWVRTTAPDPVRADASPARRPAPHLCEENR